MSWGPSLLLLPPPFLAQQAPQGLPLPPARYCRRRPPPGQLACCFGGVLMEPLLAVFMRFMRCGFHVSGEKVSAVERLFLSTASMLN